MFLLVYIVVLVLVVGLCPSSVHVVATFGLYCSACFGSLFVSILCKCCSHFSWHLLYLCVLFPLSPFLDHVSSVRRANWIKMHDRKYFFPPKNTNILQLGPRSEGSNIAPRAFIIIYRSADKSLARSGRKQPNISVRMA